MRMEAEMASELFGACPASARADREPQRPQTASAREVEQELERELERMIGDSETDEEGEESRRGGRARKDGSAGGAAQVMVLGSYNNDCDDDAAPGLDDSDVNTLGQSSLPSGAGRLPQQQERRRRGRRTAGAKSSAPTYEAAAYLEEQIANDIAHPSGDCFSTSTGGGEVIRRGAIDDLLAGRQFGSSSQRPSSAGIGQRPMSAASEKDFVASLKQGHIADLVNRGSSTKAPTKALGGLPPSGGRLRS